MAKKLSGTPYKGGDISFAMNRKSTGPSATLKGPKRAPMNHKVIAPKKG